MAAAVAASALPVTFGRLVSACSRSLLRPSWPGAASLWSARGSGSQSRPLPQSLFHVKEVISEMADRVCVAACNQRCSHRPASLPVVRNICIACRSCAHLIFQVLLVGADNFTLLGKPLLGKDLVRVEATVIEKTESWPRVNMKFKKRKNYKKKKIIVAPQTVLRINSVEIAPCLS
ncbi:39S ribosomal protein L21, mitochondrial [Pteropus vampyrus]|uniref:Large ribosomal subunit protein bL21m n=1 Tax=Pteropus vampyrus TaxID=132908 RepID=A0A6P3RKP3_PTEVA|nr:39S ribosomal protein L21, mitochondrial [Pteropus vampyrus]